MNNKCLRDQFKAVVENALLESNITPSKRFIYRIVEVILLILLLPRKVNFTQMGHFGEFCEQSYRQLFTHRIDWLKFNIALMWRLFGQESRRAIVIDPCFIPKSGRHTPHVGKYWSGSAGAVQHGLEILGIGAADIDKRDCVMLRAEQTHGRRELDLRNWSLNEWYLTMLLRHKYELLKVSKYIVADAWFSKYDFITALLTMGFEFISRLRDDAVLYYIAPEVHKMGKRGRKRIKDGRIDPSNLRKSRMERIEVGKNKETAYTAIVYCKSLKKKIRLVVYTPKGGSPKLFFSTDLKMSGEEVFEYYSVRFQIEFNFRDGKQFTGLKDCMARNEDRLDFAYNASLAALNVSKVVLAERKWDMSIGRFKSLMTTIFISTRILSVFRIFPNAQKIKKLEQEILGMPEMAS